MKLFSQRAELKRQLAETHIKKQRYEISLRNTKKKVHARLSSPVTLASSFGIGALVGFIATKKPKSETQHNDETERSSDYSSANFATPKKSLSSKFTKDLVGIGLSLLLAEATKQMKQKISQDQGVVANSNNTENINSASPQPPNLDADS